MPFSNKAAVLYGPQDIRIEESEMPVLEPDEVLIKSTDACICATEVKYWYHGMPNIKPGTKVIQGHELGGMVEDLGSHVKNKNMIGAKVAVDPSLWCGVCDMCKAGMSNLCRKLQFMSLPPVDGGNQQFYKVPEKNVHIVPAGVPSELIPLTEPVSIGLNAISDAEHIVNSLSGKNIAIVGAGSQGLVLMQIATKIREPESICIIEPLEYRCKLARFLGMGEVINPQVDNPVEKVMDITDGVGVDIAFEVSGEVEAHQLAAELVKPGGTVVIVGIPVDQEYIPIKSTTARRGGLTLTFVRRFNPKDFPVAVDMIASGKIKVDNLITHHFPLDKITPAFEMLYTYSDEVVKTIIHPHE
jgi:L-iditol 2-dehydrogenase